MPADGIERIRQALKRGGANAASQLAEAHVEFGNGRRLFLSDRLRDAADCFERAARGFRSAESPYADWAPLYRSVAHRTDGKSEAALALLDAATPPRTCPRYRYLCGRIHWMRGVVRVAQGELVEAIAEHRQALADFEAVGETEYAVGTESLLAEDYFYLGDATESWRHQSLATARLYDVPNNARRHLVLMEGVFVATWSEMPEVALHYLNTLVDMDEAEHDVAGIPEAYLHRARVKGLLGDRTALADLDRAAISLTAVADAGLKARDGAEIEAVRADLLHDRTDESVAAASSALEYFRQAQFRYRSVMILRSRARAWLESGRVDLAERDLDAGVELFEEQRQLLSQPDARLTAYEDAWGTFRDMIRLQALVKHRPDIALRYAERGRGRSLLESLDRPDEVRPASRVDPAPPWSQDTVVLYYATLPDRLLIWALTASGTTFKESLVPAATLSSQVRAVKAASLRGASTDALTSLLYEELIAPVASAVAPAVEIVIVPDAGLHDLPFGLLRQPTGRYLIEDHAMALAASLSLLQRSAAPGVHGAAPGRALIVQPPEGSSTPLAGANREAVAIASLYPEAQTLLGAEATKARMIALARSYDVVHFAGHAQSNARYPQLSHLVVAPDLRGDTDFMAYELSELPIGRTRLTVLASCDTASGRASAGEGVLSLARPILASGVPWVVASLWELDDRAASELFPRFHRLVRSGLAPHVALRDAQLALMRDPNPALRASAMWAPVVAIAGSGALRSVQPVERMTR